MPRDGSGNYTRTDGVRSGQTVWQSADAAGVNIEAPDHDVHDQDIAQALTDSLAKDGQTPMTGNLQAGNNQITALGAGTSSTDAATVGQVQGQAGTLATEAGVADAYVINPSPAITAYAAGQTFRFAPINANTGASTLSVSGLTAQAILTGDSKPLAGGELVANRLVQVTFDGSNFLLAGSQSSVTLTDDDPGAAVGPTIDLKRVSASPAGNDDIGTIRSFGQDSGGNETEYARIETEIKSPTDGVEEGAINFRVADGATGDTGLVLRLTDDEVSIPQDNDTANAGPAITLRRTSASPADNDLGGFLENAMNNSAISRFNAGRIQGKALDVSAGTEDGAWVFQVAVNGSLTDVMTVGLDATSASAILMQAANNAPLRVDRLSSDGELVQFARDGSKKGDIDVSGETVSYNGFLGSHWSGWGTGCEVDGVIPRGTLLSAVDELYTDEIDGPVPNYVKCRITSERACRRIYGAFHRVDEQGKIIVNAVGAGLVRVQGPVKGGDLLMSSDEPGVACAQDDDVIRAHTIGKVTLGHEGSDEALLPVTLVCG